METLLQDARFGVRMLRKNPQFTAVAVLSLALGIGAKTAVFTLVNAVLLKMLPVRNPSELVVIGDPQSVHARSQGSPVVDYFSEPLYRDLNAGSGQVFSRMLASAGACRRKQPAVRDAVRTEEYGSSIDGAGSAGSGECGAPGCVDSGEACNAGRSDGGAQV